MSITYLSLQRHLRNLFEVVCIFHFPFRSLAPSIQGRVLMNRCFATYARVARLYKPCMLCTVLPFQRCISSPRCHSCSTRRRYLLSILCVRKSCTYLYGSVSGHQSTPDTQFGDTAAELDSDHLRCARAFGYWHHSARLWEQATRSSAAL
jgi:hypothetical protein